MLKGIEGTFHLNAISHQTKRLLLFAGGIGITPFISMLRGLAQRSRDGIAKERTGVEIQRHIHLFYSVRDPRDLLFGREILGLASDVYPNLHLHINLTGPFNPPVAWNVSEGRISVKNIKSALGNEEGSPLSSGDTEAMICGPEPFMQHVESLLEHLGLPEGKLHLERFDF